MPQHLLSSGVATAVSGGVVAAFFLARGGGFPFSLFL